MAYTELGREFNRVTDATVPTTSNLIEAIYNEVADRLRAEFMSDLSNIMSRSFPLPNINVSAPNVSPTIEVGSPDVSIDMSQMCACLTRIEVQLSTLIRVLTTPVTREISRGAGQLITSITETRSQ